MIYSWQVVPSYQIVPCIYTERISQSFNKMNITWKKIWSSLKHFKLVPIRPNLIQSMHIPTSSNIKCSDGSVNTSSYNFTIRQTHWHYRVLKSVDNLEYHKLEHLCQWYLKEDFRTEVPKHHLDHRSNSSTKKWTTWIGSALWDLQSQARTERSYPADTTTDA